MKSGNLSSWTPLRVYEGVAVSMDVLNRVCHITRGIRTGWVDEEVFLGDDFMMIRCATIAMSLIGLTVVAGCNENTDFQRQTTVEASRRAVPAKRKLAAKTEGHRSLETSGDEPTEHPLGDQTVPSRKAARKAEKPNPQQKPSSRQIVGGTDGQPVAGATEAGLNGENPFDEMGETAFSPESTVKGVTIEVEDGESSNETVILEGLLPEEVEKDPPPIHVGYKDYEDHYPDQVIKRRRRVKRFSDDSETRHGSYTEYYPEGQLFQQGQYKDGLKVGEWTYWHANGQVAKKIKYDKGMLEGDWDVLRDNGRKSAHREFKDNKKHGEWFYYDEEGDIILRQENFQSGEREGTWLGRFRSGKKRVEERWTSNKLNGLRTVWSESGQIREEALFRQGKLHGTYRVWSEQGVLLREAEYRDGVQTNQRLTGADDNSSDPAIEDPE